MTLRIDNDECHYVQCRYDQCRYALCHYAQCHYAQCRILLNFMLSVIMLSVVMLSVVIVNFVKLCRGAADGGKHSSLLRYGKNFVHKSFIELPPVVSRIFLDDFGAKF
jgi:hypothetical protein